MHENHFEEQGKDRGGNTVLLGNGEIQPLISRQVTDQQRSKDEEQDREQAGKCFVSRLPMVSP